MELDKPSRDFIRDQGWSLIDIKKIIVESGPHFEKGLGRIYLSHSINDSNDDKRFIDTLASRINIFDRLFIDGNKIFEINTEHNRCYTKEANSYNNPPISLLYIDITEKGWEYLKYLTPTNNLNPELEVKGKVVKEFFLVLKTRIKKVIIGIFAIAGLLISSAALTPDSYGGKVIQLIFNSQK